MTEVLGGRKGNKALDLRKEGEFGAFLIYTSILCEAREERYGAPKVPVVMARSSWLESLVLSLFEEHPVAAFRGIQVRPKLWKESP